MKTPTASPSFLPLLVALFSLATLLPSATAIVCPNQAEALLTCLNQTNVQIEPAACSSCLDSADERAGDRSKIDVCVAWNTNYCTAMELCRASCGSNLCYDAFDAFVECAPAAISEATSSPCPFDECDGANHVSSGGARWSWNAAVGLASLVYVAAMTAL